MRKPFETATGRANLSYVKNGRLETCVSSVLSIFTRTRTGSAAGTGEGQGLYFDSGFHTSTCARAGSTLILYAAGLGPRIRTLRTAAWAGSRPSR